MTSGPAQHGAIAPLHGERWPLWMPVTLWAPLTTAGMLLAVGGMGLAAHQTWLFPSLAPTAFTEAEYPGHKISRSRAFRPSHPGLSPNPGREELATAPSVLEIGAVSPAATPFGRDMPRPYGSE
jgi:hypothetical protein